MTRLLLPLPVLFVLTLVGCASARGPAAAIPPAAQPAWERCRPTLASWCHDVAHGDPMQERDCLDHLSHEYVAASTEPARRQYLIAHRCNL